MSASYIPLNPFVDVSVGENHLWKSSPWVDISQIHGVAFAGVCEAIEDTKNYQQTQVRFIRGAGGSGKSHLFVRLRRKYADGILYAYAANPPLNPDAIEPWLLTCLIRSLRHRSRNVEGVEAPYSQLRLLAYVFLKPVVEQDLSVPDLHEAWERMPIQDRERLVIDASRLLSHDHPEMDAAIVQCLLTTLISEKESIASDWLAGGAYLTTGQLEILGLNDTLSRSHFQGVIHLLGRLAGLAGLPFVLALDQLDLVTEVAQLAEFQKLLMGLIDQSTSWSILVGLTADRFSFWETEINLALRGRIGTPDSAGVHGYRLPVFDVLPLDRNEQRQLIESRLLSQALVKQRIADGVQSPLFPFSGNDIDDLLNSSSSSVSPRTLLALARDRYKSSLGPQVQPQTLESAMSDLLEQEIVAQASSTELPSAVELGERLREILDLVTDHGGKWSTGRIHRSYANFDGFDEILERNGSQLCLVASNATRNSFATVLDRLAASRNDTALIRYASVPVSGRATKERLGDFEKRGNKFCLVTADDWHLLSATGSLLAALREGNYSDMRTTPPPTVENVREVLRAHPRIAGLKSLVALLSILPKTSSDLIPPPLVAPEIKPTEASIPRIDPPMPPPPTGDLGDRIRTILESHRWLEVRRLHRCLQAVGVTELLETVRSHLYAPPLNHLLTLHPASTPADESKIQIVIWNDR